jgi:histidinol-phosphatase (PHP family)
MFDCHVHSSFSGDSNMDAGLAVETAKKVGLEGIAFTDHLDFDYPDYDDVFLIDFNEYSEYMNRLKQECEGFRVLKGIEVGIQPHVVKESLEVVKKYGFDIVIGSVHIVDKLDLHNGDFCRGKTKKESYSRYLETVLECISLFDDFDVLGHIDLIRRYGCYDDKTLSINDYRDYIDAILNKLISDGRGIEVNTSGYRYKLDSPMPDYEIIKRYRELNGEIICTSSDAHTPDYIGYKFDYINELLLKAGFKYTTHFENRKPVFTSITL